MLRNLSGQDRETLMRLVTNGPGGDLDLSILNKLFSLGLIEIAEQRAVILTETGRTVYAEIARHAEANEQQRTMR